MPFYVCAYTHLRIKEIIFVFGTTIVRLSAEAQSLMYFW